VLAWDGVLRRWLFAAVSLLPANQVSIRRGEMEQSFYNGETNIGRMMRWWSGKALMSGIYAGEMVAV
jgi:hypothetical protein